jgi:uncharacterized protein with HEPN domain
MVCAKKYKHIPWRAIAGMRDITVHKYQTLKMGDVWVTLINDIPKLKKQLNNREVIKELFLTR